MKYIRTKDGKIMKHPHPNEEVFTFRYEIIKSANTIKELCDKWVIVENGKPHILAYECDLLDKINNNKKLGIETFGFGSIWVKGEHNEPTLRPVAKMNEKGKLDLI